MPPNGTWRFAKQILLLLSITGLLLTAVLGLTSRANLKSIRHLKPQTAASPSHGYSDRISTSQDEGVLLRHVFHHGAGQLGGPRARRLDISSERAAKQEVTTFGPFIVKTAPVPIDRPAIKGFETQMPMSTYWISEELPGPNVTDKDTVVNLAWMSEDAYKPDRWDPEWVDIGEKYNKSIPFGWDDNGIRGHVFVDATNSSVILSIKGTSVSVFEGNGTSTRDKENDNLFGSCCCGQGGPYLWRTVCDCQTGTFSCDQKCVKEELREKNMYYEGVLELFDEVIAMYPDANIMTVGHSLGGVLASFIGLHHGIPSVTFEAYPQALAASRLGLPVAGNGSPLRRNTGGYHFGHTADPIYMGSCNGASSFCSIAGFAFETLCHTGKRCVYDVVKDWGWRQSTNAHRLRKSIQEVYEVYNTSAPCEDEAVDCVDCYLWKFENGTHTKPSTTTTTSTTSSKTRTETCKTPGWWGCRDETTTSDLTTTSSTTTTTTLTSTCKTPGWFGCKDQTTSTTTTTSSPATTTTCTSEGWFGRCLDSSSTTTSSTAAAAYWRTVQTATQTPY
ncbi:autophagy related lipase-like protein Atg15 [Polyplosphaeria fusca]|uniref:triacylglycerol lipase n=1 Tax=Polyplosphaeria fusca TaxID=682080 RepID=A0A9P4V9K0_9PLEO|nr:autophagy related lipase-like protein Atg15 [Polyplosphaeria fusca]